jgi:hypothetical protein
LTGRASIRKFAPLLIAGFIGALAAVAMIYFAIVVRDPIELSRGDAKPQPSSIGILATGGGVLGNAGRSGPITASPTAIPAVPVPILTQQTTVHSDRRPTAPRPEKKPARHRAWQHDRPRDSVSAQAEREETVRLMRDELRQRGIPADAGSGSERPD